MLLKLQKLSICFYKFIPNGKIDPYWNSNLSRPWKQFLQKLTYLNTFLLQKNWASYRLRVVKPNFLEAWRAMILILFKKMYEHEQNRSLHHGYLTMVTWATPSGDWYQWAHERGVWCLAVPAPVFCLGLYLITVLSALCVVFVVGRRHSEWRFRMP